MPDKNSFHDEDKFGTGRVRFLNINDPRSKDLFQYQKGEGGAYINDHLRMVDPAHPSTARISFSSTQIPKQYATMILDQLEITEFNNKEFVRINGDDELEGMRDEPMCTFLYLHDYTFYLYNLR